MYFLPALFFAFVLLLLLTFPIGFRAYLRHHDHLLLGHPRRPR